MTPSPEFLLIAVSIGTAAAVAFYMAGRHASVTTDYAFKVIEVVREYEPDEGTMDGSQLTFDQALEKRNEVLDAVADANVGWLDQALAEMRKIPDGIEGTGEQFRKMLLEGGLPQPARPHAWGAMVNTMTRRGLLIRTGERRPMLDPRAHGRSTDVYVKRTPAEAA